MAVARQFLSRERVLAAALASADVDGLESLSMRGLGGQLGVEAMSLYNHVKNKDDLVAGMCELAWREVEPPPAGTPWREGVRGLALSTHAMLLRHPWMIPRRGSPGGPPQIRCINALLGCLREDGFAPMVAYHSEHVVDSFVFGYAHQEVWYAASAASLEGEAAALEAARAFEGLAHLQEHIGHHIQQAQTGEDGGFEFGLDLILDGLAGLRTSSPAGH